MDTLDEDFANGIWTDCAPPCLSLYQPTHRHHPDNQQDPVRFRQGLKTLEASLQRQLGKQEIRALLEPFERLADDREFWNHTLDGLAVLGSKDLFRVYLLQRPVAELAVVANSFHTKPLLRILQSADRFHILAVSRRDIRLYEGNRDTLAQIEPAAGVPRTVTEALGDELTEPRQTVASYGGIGRGRQPMHHGHGGKEAEVDNDAERFFRAVDRAVLEHHSRPSGLPLILAGLPEHHHRFHEVSRNPNLLQQSIDVHPDALATLDELRMRAWELVEPRYLARLAELVDQFNGAGSKGLAADGLTDIARAIIAGRVATLLIEARREIPGRIDLTSGDIEFDDLSHPELDDVLDDMAALALEYGADVVIVPAERMPTGTGAAAIFRY